MKEQVELKLTLFSFFFTADALSKRSIFESFKKGQKMTKKSLKMIIRIVLIIAFIKHYILISSIWEVSLTSSEALILVPVSPGTVNQ